MKVNLSSLSKFSNPEKYTKSIDLLEKNMKLLENNRIKYTNEHDYDKIVKLHDENKALVEAFRRFLGNKELLMEDILECIKKHQDIFLKNSNIKELSKSLNIEHNFGEESSNITSINDLYGKIQENSNLVIIYDIGKKKFHQIPIDKTFNSKCYSYYCNDIKTIYVSGGLIKYGNSRVYSDSFFKISIKLHFDEFKFEFVDLSQMNTGRASHTIIQYGDFFIAVGGLNTKSTEIYDISKDKWVNLPDLPHFLLNPALSIHNNSIYALSGSGGPSTYDGIYKMSLNNLSRVVKGEKGFEDILNWEKVEYRYEILNRRNFPRLRRGMAALGVRDGILLFGGFDNDNIYDDIFQFNYDIKVNVKDDKNTANNNQNKIIEDENKSKTDNSFDEIDEVKVPDIEEIDVDNCHKITDTDIELPMKTFFNSNLLLFDYYLIMIDGFNNALEFNLKTQEFYYYT